MVPRTAAVASTILGIALLSSGCPEEEEKNLPPLSGTGAGSLPGGGPDDAGNPPPTSGETGTTGETETDTGRASSGSDTAAGSDTQGDGATIGATSLGEPPMVTTGIVTTG